MIENRIQQIRQLISENELDAMMVLIEENRYYLSGFTGEDHQFDESAGALFITRNDLILATDSRFEIQARSESPMYEVVIYKKGLHKELPKLVKRMNITRLGFESIRVSVKQYRSFKRELEASSDSIELVPTQDLIEGLRLIKSSHEIEQSRNALALAEEAFCKVVNTLRPGMTEKEVAWQLERGMRMTGAQGLSFPVIVAAGPNSALPHAIPTDRPIKEGEPILFDWGAILGHYCSDTSRTIILGAPDETFLEIHSIVLDAQQKAIAAIKADAGTKDIDAVARDYISAKGYGEKFGHGLGHGTGLAVHEGPRLSPLKETVLKSGMIVTVEPGIYLPEWGGVRIENQVVVEKESARVLNRLSTSYDVNHITIK